MLKRAIRVLLWLLVLAVPMQLWAADSCFQCVLGIWDDIALTSNLGQIEPGQPKDVYVGIKFAEGFDGLSGIEFSVATPIGVHIGTVEPIISEGAWIICNPEAPSDTSSSSTQTGGCDFAWSRCLVGNQALLRVTLIASSNVTNAILRVKRHYPPASPEVKTPFFFQCDDPQFTVARLTGGYYILNWNGDPSVRVDGSSWSMVKELYQ
jgi:hypothetical protein